MSVVDVLTALDGVVSHFSARTSPVGATIVGVVNVLLVNVCLPSLLTKTFNWINDIPKK